jgi:tellurite methyltransferase
MSDGDRAKWDARWAERGRTPAEPSPFVISLDAILPRAGRALDVAGGAGRHALWLAQRGLDVTLVDVSEVALAFARRHAEERGVRITTVSADLLSGGLPAGPWDVIVCFHYLERALFDEFPSQLAAGGLLVFVQPTRSNLERHAQPSARFLLEDGELPSLVRGVEILRYEEGWLEEGRHEARLVAVRRRG